MKQSQYFIPTLKDVSSDVQMTSHKLMLRAGLMRSIGAGIFSWLPLGWRVIERIKKVLQDEMNKIGGQEFHLPALNPIEYWEETNRVEAMGDVMFHIKNRDGLVLAPTHEEIMTLHAKQHISSYRDMPMIWYQIQSKFRNEARPRSGVLRGRQFFMKDSYSLDTSFENLDISYDKHYNAYKAIFDRCGIKYFIVGASSGAMGGSKSQEFMVENEFGEDVCAISDSGYAANIEVATSALKALERTKDNLDAEIFETPKSKTIDDLVKDFNLDEKICAKSLIYIVDKKPVMILMRGNDELNISKVESFFVTTDIRPAQDEEIFEITGAKAGSLGPKDLLKNIDVYADNLLLNCNGLVSGANKTGYHFKNIDLDRDANIKEYSDFRTVMSGEPDIIDGSEISVVKAIELGHIFKLGTKYSDSMGAKFLDADGKEKNIVMGSYGIGVERIAACFIEQNSDDNGIKWNKELAPFDVHIVGINTHKDIVVSEYCENLYSQLKKENIEVLYDDRDVSPGFKFKDADLIGIPIQLIIGSRSLNDNLVEVKIRVSGEKIMINTEELLDFLKKN